MIDSVIKGTGNSRKLKSISNFAAQYPTYEAFASAMASGTLPIDLGINEAGWAQLGTALNKGNLFSDTTAAKYPAGTDTPDQALGVLGDAAVVKSAVVRTDIAGEWWTGVQHTDISNINNVDYIKELGILYVSTSSGFYYSTDLGRSFTKIIDSNNTFHVAYGNGIVVAIGPNGKYYKSTNGKTFTEHTTTTGYFNGIIFDGKRFVASKYMNNYSYASYSTDGVNWTDRDLKYSSYWAPTTVQFVDGYYIFYLQYSGSGATRYTSDIVNGSFIEGTWKFLNGNYVGVEKFKNKYFAVNQIDGVRSLQRSDSPCNSVNLTSVTVPGSESFSFFITDENLFIVGNSSGSIYKLEDPSSNAMNLIKVAQPISNSTCDAVNIPSNEYPNMGIIVSNRQTLETFDKYATEDELQSILGTTLQIPARQILDNVQVVLGSYIGTGTYGSNNPNTLTFPFEPKIVIVLRNILEDFKQGNLIIQGQTKSAGIGYGGSSSGYSLKWNIQWSGTSVSWYYSNNVSENTASRVEGQFNTSGEVYLYAAIG